MEYEVTDLEHDRIEDGLFTRVMTSFRIKGTRYWYHTYNAGEPPQSVRYSGPNDLNETQYVYCTQLPKHVRDFIDQQMPIVAILLS
jgi:hypothetical protein